MNRGLCLFLCRIYYYNLHWFQESRLEPARSPRRHITPNRSEASRISGIEITDMESAQRAAKAIHDMGPRNVIITLGSDGSLVYDGKMFMRVEALKVEAVDTTAAGDTYNGVLASVIAEGRSLIEAVREANIAGAISVTRMGAQPAAPTRNEIEEMKKRK